MHAQSCLMLALPLLLPGPDHPRVNGQCRRRPLTSILRETSWLMAAMWILLLL
jgi:hypothetical protein